MKLLGRAYMIWCTIFILLPIIVVAGAALNGGRSMLFPPKDPTLDRFIAFFIEEDVWVTSLGNSAIIAIGSAALATLFAWPVAYRLWRDDTAFSRTLASLGALPFALPPIVFGVGLGFLWGMVGGLGSIWTGMLSHAALHAALPLVTTSIGLQAIDRAQLDAAATMGAKEPVVLRSIILPQMFPYTVAGFLFALVLSFNEFIVMFFVSSSSYSTVTLQIFNSLRNGFTPTMAVGAITFILTSVLVFALIGRFGDLPRLMGADQSQHR